MTAPYFVTRGEGLTVREIAVLAQAEPRRGADLERRITGIAALDRATPSDLVFLDNRRYVDQASACRAGACLTSERFAHALPASVSLLVVRYPYRDFVEVAARAFPGRVATVPPVRGERRGPWCLRASERAPGERRGSRSGAVIGPRAENRGGQRDRRRRVIGPEVRIGRNCAVGPMPRLPMP